MNTDLLVIEELKSLFAVISSEDEEAVNEAIDTLNKTSQIAAQNSFKMAVDVAAMQKLIPSNFVMGVMRTADFIALRGFGKNRDVAKRLKNKKYEQLRGDMTSQQQHVVSVVLTNDKNGEGYYQENLEFMKIDGHSRAAAWLTGQLSVPEYVHVQFFFGLSDEQIVKEYDVFNRDATRSEKNDIKNKLNGFAPKSKFVQSSWKDAFTKCGYGYEEGLKRYMPCLLAIDELGFTPESPSKSTRRQVTGIKSAILESWEDIEEKGKWLEFWKDFYQSESTIEESQSLRAFVLENKGNGGELNNKVHREAVQKVKVYAR
ncbi:hypothetical protein R3B00_001314 [Klebsiella pneumoniae]|nr:hypothetical protein [Klebsiella pneumoniae]ELQ8980652.1 hypothetical protein [Klebsiella pneumoniae]